MATTESTIATTPTKLHHTALGMAKKQSFTESTPMSSTSTSVRDYSAPWGRERISTADQRQSTCT